MRFMQYYADGKPALGLVKDKGIISLRNRSGFPQTMLECCELDDLSVFSHLDGPYIVESSLTPAPVITGMEKIICVGLNYRDHVKEMGHTLPGVPTIFSKFANALSAHEQEIVLPPSHKIDYEAELVLIMGKNGKIFACTAGNDLSARDWQKETSQWLCGKSCDGFAPLGPVAVTTDELDCSNLHIESYVNGELRQSACTSDMIFSPEKLVAFLQTRMTLKPGDLIFTGTPSGVIQGYPEDKQEWLKAGDVVDINIEHIGLLRSYLV